MVIIEYKDHRFIIYQSHDDLEDWFANNNISILKDRIDIDQRGKIIQPYDIQLRVYPVIIYRLLNEEDYIATKLAWL